MLALISIFLSLSGSASSNTSAAPAKTFHDFSALDIDGKEVKLSDYKGKTVMVVNTASKCGFTYQYEGLQKTYEKYKSKGFVVLGFPANDFMGQEPGDNKEIKYFCTSKYKVSFPIFGKSVVKGKEKTPLYEFLTTAGPRDTQGEISWNFNKFLINKKGEIVKRFGSSDKPDSSAVQRAIEFNL